MREKQLVAAVVVTEVVCEYWRLLTPMENPAAVRHPNGHHLPIVVVAVAVAEAVAEAARR